MALLILSLLAICLAALVVIVQSSLQHVEYSVNNFMKYYLPGQAVWLGHTSYAPDWCRANGVEALSNFLYYFGNSSSYDMSSDFGSKMEREEEKTFWDILTAVQDHQGTNFYQDATYFDDVLWWSLAYSRAYFVSMNRGDAGRANRFLATSVDIHDVVTRDSWTEQPCNGGVFWSREYSYKNAITNELYFSAAARLFQITGNSTFLDRATKTINWLQSSGMIQSNFQIVDGLANATCKAQGAVYTYNQGVLLGGLAELGAVSNATYKSELINLGENMANAVSTLMTDSNGILTETNCGDGALFKGIYTRYLRYFLDVAQPSSTDKLKKFLTAQSSSIWNAARDANTGFFAKQWVGPAGSKFHNLQISGIDALTAAGELYQGNKVDGCLDCNGRGTLVDGVCLCDERFWGSCCGTETNTAYYYADQKLTFTSSAIGRVLCVEPMTLTVTTCVDDDKIAASGTWYFQQYHDTFHLVYMDTNTNKSYFLSADGGKVSVINAGDVNSSSEAATMFSTATSHPQDKMYSDSLSLRTTDGKYINVNVNNFEVTAESTLPSKSTIFGTNYAQVC